jgi:hypothetical protein
LFYHYIFNTGGKVGLEKMVQTHPVLFEHWRIGMIGAFA